MEKLTKNDYYVFIGENATTGTPNKITGRMSYFGDILIFKSKKDAIEFVNDYRGYGLCIAGNKKKMREYSLGMSVSAFEEDIMRSFYTVKDKNDNWEY